MFCHSTRSERLHNTRRWVGALPLTMVMAVTLLGAGGAFARKDHGQEDREEAWDDYYKARKHAHRGQFRRALDDIDEALEGIPGEDQFKLTKAYILLDLGRDEQAIPILQEIMESSASRLAADARHELEHLGQVGPVKNPDAPARSGGVSMSSGPGSGKTDSPNVMKSGSAESGASKDSRRDSSQAEPGLHREASRSESGNRARCLAWEHYEYGRHLAKMGWLEKSMRPLDRAIQLWPEEGRFFLTRGLVQFDLGNREDAVKDLNSAREKGYGWVKRRAADELELMGEVVKTES